MKIDNYKENIIIGSLLGDGNLAISGRSINAHYREHFSPKQLDYRIWKCNKLIDLNFKLYIRKNYYQLTSPSNPLYTHYYNLFYNNKIKIVTKENIKLLNHPIGLACLYFDDGTLVIDSTTRNNGCKYLFPRISISTLCFSKEENLILINHIYNVFSIKFKLKQFPYGKGYALELNKKDEIFKFINLISPYVKDIKSMSYKINIYDRLISKQKEIPHSTICNLYTTIHPYSNDEIDKLLQLHKEKVPYKEIAKILDRTYYSVVYKLRDLEHKKEWRINLHS